MIFYFLCVDSNLAWVSVDMKRITSSPLQLCALHTLSPFLLRVMCEKCHTGYIEICRESLAKKVVQIIRILALGRPLQELSTLT